MNDSTQPKIQQQMYTRERRGIFRSTEGFDTIARSAGLDHSFVKKVLHPFCQYDAPAELVARGEKEAAMYPEALLLFHAENGETVLGRSSYQPADFTGLRSAFFTHNYVLPAGYVDEPSTDYKHWLNAVFADQYDIEQGTDIPELSAIPVHARAAAPVHVQSLLAELHISEQIFKQLLYAAMTSVAGKKKVYIVLDVPVEQSAKKAEQLLDVLFASLPYELRRQLGFLTYAKEPHSKRGVHLMFVEKGSLRLNDRSIEKDYLFELAAQRVINVDLDWTKQPFLDFAWDNLGNPQRAESFFAFADQLLSDMEPLRKISISSYHELSVLFQIEEGNEQLYEAHSSEMLRAMLEYLSTSGAIASKVRLNDLFLTYFDHEFDKVKQGGVPEADIVECMKDYYTIDGRNHGRKIVEYLIRVLNNANSHKNKLLVPAVYRMIENTPALSRTFFATVLSSPGLPAMLFDPYFEGQLKQAARARDVIDIVSVWIRNHPIVLENDLFIRLAEGQMVEKLRKESDPVVAVNVILDQLDHLEHNPQSGISSAPGGTKLMDKLIYAANLFLLMDINLDRLTKEQLLQIDFLRVPKEFKAWVTRFDTRIQSKAAVMLATYQWMNSDTDSTKFAGLSPAEREQVQQLGRRWLQHEVEPSRFGTITLAFCQDIETGAVDYTSLLEFLHHYGPKPDMVYKYIQWSVKEPLFVRPRGLVPAYANAIVKFMKKYDSAAFKNKEYAKMYFDQAPAVLKPVYAKAKTELASPLVKLFRRNRKPFMLSSIVLLIIIAAGSTYLILQANGGFEGSKTASDQLAPAPVTPPVVPEPVVEVPLLTAAQEKVGTNKNKTTQLLFHFRETEACRIYAAKHIAVLAADGTTLAEVQEPKLDHNCVDAADTSGTGANMGGTTGDSTGTDANKGTDATKDKVGDKSGQAGQTSTVGKSEEQVGATDDKTTKGETGTGITDPAKKDDTVGKDVTPPEGTKDPADGSTTTVDKPYSSWVKVDLAKKIDLTKISKVVVDDKEFTLTTDPKMLEQLKQDSLPKK